MIISCPQGAYCWFREIRQAVNREMWCLERKPWGMGVLWQTGAGVHFSLLDSLWSGCTMPSGSRQWWVISTEGHLQGSCEKWEQEVSAELCRPWEPDNTLALISRRHGALKGLSGGVANREQEGLERKGQEARGNGETPWGRWQTGETRGATDTKGAMGWSQHGLGWDGQRSQWNPLGFVVMSITERGGRGTWLGDCVVLGMTGGYKWKCFTLEILVQNSDWRSERRVFIWKSTAQKDALCPKLTLLSFPNLSPSVVPDLSSSGPDSPLPASIHTLSSDLFSRFWISLYSANLHWHPIPLCCPRAASVTSHWVSCKALQRPSKTRACTPRPPHNPFALQRNVSKTPF